MTGPVYVEVKGGQVTTQPAAEWEHEQHVRNLEEFMRRGDRPGYAAYLQNAARSLTEDELEHLKRRMKYRADTAKECGR
jgi:hypothetical protein